MADESNSFQLSVDALNELDRMHDNHQFVKYDKVELYLVKPEDDPVTERIVYGFGSSCPLALAKGVTMCKSFKEKLFCCKSVLSRKMARNYLAKHAFDSDNHPTKNDKSLACKWRRASGDHEETQPSAFRAHCSATVLARS